MSKITKIVIWILLAVIVIGGVWYFTKTPATTKEPIKVGFIGAMTGSVAKYGAWEAVQLAAEDINNSGGINGRPIEIIAEDGKCDGSTAVSAINKLINIDKVKIVLGGHCTSESASIAPIAEANKVIMLASITTTPVLTSMGDYVFRTSPVSTVQSGLIADLAFNRLGLKKMVIVYEQTDYAKPIAEKLKDRFSGYGGEVVVYENYAPGANDFRTTLLKVKNSGADSIFLSAQSPDAALNFMKQVKELGLDKLKLFGNEAAGIAVNTEKNPELYEGFILAEPDFNESNSKTSAFINSYNQKYNTKNLPYGIWTAESYDAVMIIADGLKKYGDDVEKNKNYLYNLKDYDGVSGKISIDKNGDGVREYSLKIIKDGKKVKYSL